MLSPKSSIVQIIFKIRGLSLSPVNTSPKNLYQPSQPRLLQVKSITDVCPKIRRLTLAGDALKGYPENIPAAHIKIFIPRSGQAKPILPKMGPKGAVWPEEQLRPHTRTYSVRRFCPNTMEIDVDFALHGDEGPASAFAIYAKIGDYIGISNPGGPYPMLPKVQHYVFAGDLTAIPAISALLESLPQNATGDALLEISTEQDKHELVAPPGVKLHWLINESESPLPSAIRSLSFQTQDVFYWVAGENDTVLNLRRYIRGEKDIHRSCIYAVPYWKKGLNEEGYHNERHDVMDKIKAE